MRKNYTIIFVSNMKRSVTFYRDVLRLSVKFESTHWTEFANTGTTVALHLSEQPNPDHGNGKETVAGRCRPGFTVPDLDLFHKNMLSAGVTCVQEPKETFGAWIAQYLDPDGLVLSVSEERSGSGSGSISVNGFAE